MPSILFLRRPPPLCYTHALKFRLRFSEVAHLFLFRGNQLNRTTNRTSKLYLSKRLSYFGVFLHWNSGIFLYPVLIKIFIVKGDSFMFSSNPILHHHLKRPPHEQILLRENFDMANFSTSLQFPHNKNVGIFTE